MIKNWLHGKKNMDLKKEINQKRELAAVVQKNLKKQIKLSLITAVPKKKIDKAKENLNVD